MSSLESTYTGQKLFQQGRPEEALEIFQNLLEQNPDDPEILNNIGVIQHHFGQREEALHFLLRALKSDTHHADALSNLYSLLISDLDNGELISSLKTHVFENDGFLGKLLSNLVNIEGSDSEINRRLIERFLESFPGHLGPAEALITLLVPEESMPPPGSPEPSLAPWATDPNESIPTFNKFHEKRPLTIGMIGRSDNSGLGMMTLQYARNLRIENLLIITASHKDTDYERFPGAQFLPENTLPSDDTLRAFYGNLDVLLTIETPYNPNAYNLAREMGVKTVLIPMVECTRMDLFKEADLFLCHSLMDFRECPFDNKIHLPFPMNTSELSFIRREGPARTFVHIAGYGSFHGRNGTREVIEAFKKMNHPELRLIIYSQVPMDIENGAANIEVRGEVPCYTDLYREGEVLLFPFKFGAMDLPVMEALASGMPVVLNRLKEWEEWLIDDHFGVDIERHYAVSIPKIGIPVFAVEPSIDDLFKTIIWCSKNDMGPYSEKAREWAEGNNWEVYGEQILDSIRNLLK